MGRNGIEKDIPAHIYLEDAARQQQGPGSVWRMVSTMSVVASYVHSMASAPLCRHQVILIDDKGTRVLTTCPEWLREVEQPAFWTWFDQSNCVVFPDWYKTVWAAIYPIVLVFRSKWFWPGHDFEPSPIMRHNRNHRRICTNYDTWAKKCNLILLLYGTIMHRWQKIRKPGMSRDRWPRHAWGRDLTQIVLI